MNTNLLNIKININDIDILSPQDIEISSPTQDIEISPPTQDIEISPSTQDIEISPSTQDIEISPSTQDIEQNINEIDLIIQNIIILCQHIYDTLGSGFAECVYHKALLYDLIELNFNIESHKIIPILYKNKNVGYGEIDLYLYTKQNKDIIIELKAISTNIGLKEKTQLITYKKNINLETIGLIINFPQPTSKLVCSQIEYLIV